MPQEEAILRAAREHPVGFFHTSGDQVVDQDPEIGLGAVDDEWILTLDGSRSVDAGNQPLGGGFLVSGRSVDLAGEVEPRDILGFEGRVKLGGGAKSYSTA